MKTASKEIRNIFEVEKNIFEVEKNIFEVEKTTSKSVRNLFEVVQTVAMMAIFTLESVQNRQMATVV